MSQKNVIETDVLVIGGGMAGGFAAVKAKETGVDVTLVDKGYAGKSGQTPFAGNFSVFNADWGDDLDAWVEQITRSGDYVNNRVWTEIAYRDSYARYQDLVSWGVKFDKDENGELLRSGSPLGPCLGSLINRKVHSESLRKQALKSGVNIMDRIMITDLLKQDGCIVGAIGIPIDRYCIYIFKAKATVLCSGAAGFKPPGWPIHALTADGDAMAYRIGAEITGKEFVDTHSTRAEHPAFLDFPNLIKHGMTPGRLVNAEDNEVIRLGGLFLDMEFEAHAGRAPLIQETAKGNIEKIGGGASGMSVHKAEGIWPADTDCSTSIPGLYAAGDALGTMQMGAAYAGKGCALMGASVTGAKAGTYAADYSREADKSEPDGEEITRLEKIIRTPTERKGGFSPRWVTQLLQNSMIPYYVMFVKKEDRMKAVLTMVEFMRDHLVPKLTAKDPHELRLAIDTKNMVLNAEMKLKASLFRTESRGCHYREDYPRRDDPNWLAWVVLKEENGEMTALRKPIPEEWWPDLSKPEEERYMWRFPKEGKL